MARSEHLQTDDEIDRFIAATMGMTVDDLHAADDPESAVLSDAQIQRLLG